MAGIEEELTLGPEQGELSLPALGKLHDWVITVDHKRLGIMYIAGGLLFWWPIVNPGSISGKWDRSFAPVYLFLATLPCDALSAFLAFCGRVVYPSHHSGHPHFGLTPLQDQECAGALMWFWVTIAYLIPAVVITVRMLSPSSRRVGPPIPLQVHQFGGHVEKRRG